MSATMAYLDHAATTPVRPVARAALRRALDLPVGNPSAGHAAAQAHRAGIEAAREDVADAVGASPHDVVFTSGGTEADNLAVQGLARGARADSGRAHLVVSAVEHPAVLATARWLAHHGGFELSVVGVDRAGRVDPMAVAAAVRPDTALVSVMLANNELGTVQDLAAVSAAVRSVDPDVVLHTDAVQALSTLEVDVGQLGVDALSLSGHKIGAPVGIGALVVRRGVAIHPVLHGGGQEREVRSGTLAHALTASLGAAVRDAVEDRPRLAAAAAARARRIRAVTGRIDGVRPTIPADVTVLPTHVHLTIDGVDGAELLFALDRAGVAAAGGSACAAGATGASHVVEACGIEADAVLRLTTGWTTTDEEVDHACDVLLEVVSALRAGRPVVGSDAPAPLRQA